MFVFELRFLLCVRVVNRWEGSISLSGFAVCRKLYDQFRKLEHDFSLWLQATWQFKKGSEGDGTSTRSESSVQCTFLFVYDCVVVLKHVSSCRAPSHYEFVVSARIFG